MKSKNVKKSTLVSAPVFGFVCLFDEYILVIDVDLMCSDDTWRMDEERREVPSALGKMMVPRGPVRVI